MVLIVNATLLLLGLIVWRWRLKAAAEGRRGVAEKSAMEGGRKEREKGGDVEWGVSESEYFIIKCGVK